MRQLTLQFLKAVPTCVLLDNLVYLAIHGSGLDV